MSSDERAPPGTVVRPALVPLAASAAAALMVVATADRLVAVQPHWPLLGLLAAACAAVLAVFARRGRLVEPLPLVAFVLLTAFAGRALQLAWGSADLLSYRPSSGDLSTGLALRSQEIALYFSRKLTVDPDTALARALAALVLFAAALLVGYRSALGRRLARRLVLVGRGTDALDLRVAVAVLLGVGLSAHAAIYARIGGPVAALRNILGQSNLDVPFPLLVAAGFTTVAVLLWYVWHPPATAAARWWFAAAVCETVVFWATTGSRTHALAPLFVLFVARHHIRRRWTTAQMVVIGSALMLVASTYLVVRQATYSAALGDALRQAPRYAVNPSATLFDNTTFDDFLAAVNTYGITQAHGHGEAVASAVRSFVPEALDPGRPQGSDVEFRRLLLGDGFRGGRPYSVVGDLHRDFGYAGVALGALLLGVLVRGLAGLVDARAPARGRRLRVVLAALSMLALYGLLVGTYSIALGDVIELGTPLALALLVFARPATAAGVRR